MFPPCIASIIEFDDPIFFLCLPHTQTLIHSHSLTFPFDDTHKKTFWMPRVFCHLILRTKTQATTPEGPTRK